MNKSNLKILFFMLILAAAAPLFAADLIPPGLDNISTQLEGAFKSPLITVILIGCLVGCGVAYAFNKDNEKMKRNIIAIGIGIIIITAARGIVTAIMDAAKG